MSAYDAQTSKCPYHQTEGLGKNCLNNTQVRERARKCLNKHPYARKGSLVEQSDLVFVVTILLSLLLKPLDILLHALNLNTKTHIQTHLSIFVRNLSAYNVFFVLNAVVYNVYYYRLVVMHIKLDRISLI